MFGKIYRYFFHSIHTWQMARAILNLAARFFYCSGNARHFHLKVLLKRQAVGTEHNSVVDVVGR
jgi:hypothetical protein